MPGVIGNILTWQILEQPEKCFRSFFVAVSAFLLIVMVIVMSAQRPIQIINASRNTTESVHRCLFVSFKRE